MQASFGNWEMRLQAHITLSMHQKHVFSGLAQTANDS